MQANADPIRDSPVRDGIKSAVRFTSQEINAVGPVDIAGTKSKGVAWDHPQKTFSAAKSRTE
jgi:hypothetical protein